MQKKLRDTFAPFGFPFRRRLLSLVVISTVYASAHADDNDLLTLTVGGGFTHDNNLFRTPDATQSDTIRRLIVGAKAKTMVSLQKFSIDASLNDNHYQHFSDLDFYGGNSTAVWDWVIGDRATGKLGYKYERFISDFGDIRTQTRDMVSRRTPFFSLNYALTPEWQLAGDTSQATTKHSDSARSGLDSEVNSASFGINYWTSTNNKIGAVVRRSNADYPHDDPISILDNTGGVIGTITRASQSYKETENALVGIWNITGVSMINARIGYTRREHNEIPARDFSGTTGEIIYHWTPTPTTAVDLDVYRKIQSSDDLSASYVLFRGIGIIPSWSPMPALNLKFRAIREMRDYNGDPGFTLGASQRRADSFQSTQISATYAPTKRTELSIAFERGKRNSNLDSFDYKYNLASAQIKFSL